MKKIAIAIAAYNCEKDIVQCVESVLRQCKDTVEILIINDGSTDCTLERCNEIAYCHPSVRVVSQINSGLSAVRNRSIREADSEYILFMDADDLLPDETIRYYEEFLSKYGPTDIIFGNYNLVNGAISHKAFSLNCCEGVYGPQDKVNILSCCLEGSGFDSSKKVALAGAAWGKIYNLNFLKNHKLYFDEKLPRAQDVSFNLRVIQQSNLIGYIDRSVYEYRIIEGSKSHRTNINLLNEMINFNNSIENLILNINNDSLYNDYCHYIMNQIDAIAKRGGYAEKGIALHEALRAICQVQPYLNAITRSKIRKAAGYKEALKTILYKFRQYRLLSVCFNYKDQM